MLLFTRDIMIERKDMDGNFSFLNIKRCHFELDSERRVQGHIARLSAPSEIQVKDLTLKEFAPMTPSNNNTILMWTSDYEIHYKGHVLVKLKMQQQYSCQSFVRAVAQAGSEAVDAE
jgi:hypothetical protein